MPRGRDGAQILHLLNPKNFGHPLKIFLTSSGLPSLGLVLPNGRADD
jgi:hypothetical protein